MDEIRIDINSEIFEPMLNGINEKLSILFEAMAAGEFYGGDITAKITIELQQAVKNYDRISPLGAQFVEEHEFERPVIDYKVKLILKKQIESKGRFYEVGMELVKENGQWILRDLPDQQIKMIMEFEETPETEGGIDSLKNKLTSMGLMEEKEDIVREDENVIEPEEDGFEPEPGREDDE